MWQEASNDPAQRLAMNGLFQIDANRSKACR